MTVNDLIEHLKGYQEMFGDDEVLIYSEREEEFFDIKGFHSAMYGLVIDV